MTSHVIRRRMKVIEIAIPMEAINAASARGMSIRHGLPSTLHLWWAARRQLLTCSGNRPRSRQ
ncbi:DUF1156 domain-containing protein [Synechococcus sp. CS-1324]|uniref:DUF1156 domain-containing protein n=1 Tax=Synechococcus sp. CS-1324 TaxID=2847980 RepID=UPI000DB411C8|nr:DUF1156 domain-containing protein [Synechococcus sp. CS-1324]MCT0230138.1 DUF1156 domain-containing protein [Synechococcus sp. CS-1324]PZV05239.1 MAG: hypothetical protein DCF23_03915 [Cyanobium sp.]